MHENTAIEHMGCHGCGCGGFWQTNGKVMRRREEVEAPRHKQGNAGTGAKIWDEKQLTESHIHRVGLGIFKLQKKMCLFRHAPNTMNFDGRDLE